jgi:hypothetical protein
MDIPATKVEKEKYIRELFYNSNHEIVTVAINNDIFEILNSKIKNKPIDIDFIINQCLSKYITDGSIDSLIRAIDYNYEVDGVLSN